MKAQSADWFDEEAKRLRAEGLEVSAMDHEMMASTLRITESHNATPAQHETATSAENHNETDS